MDEQLPWYSFATFILGEAESKRIEEARSVVLADVALRPGKAQPMEMRIDRSVKGEYFVTVGILLK